MHPVLVEDCAGKGGCCGKSGESFGEDYRNIGVLNSKYVENDIKERN